jgi:hypothetical protein
VTFREVRAFRGRFGRLLQSTDSERVVWRVFFLKMALVLLFEEAEAL